MSTSTETERMPASFSRAIIHAGVGRVGSTPRTMRVANTAEPTRPRIGASSRISTGNASAAISVAMTCSTGSRNRAPVACAYSRATPRMENA
jgi:hypothetical protein